MDPALAERHGVDYVHLAVFAIDVDRLREGVEIDPAATEWTFGWEVFLTERYLVSHLDPASEAHRALLEDACLGLLERAAEHPRGEPPLGSQLLFAVWDGVRRGALPAELEEIFRAWRRPPRELAVALDAMVADAEAGERVLAEACLELPAEPPLAPPTARALEAMTARFTVDG